MVKMIHHAARTTAGLPANSLAALAECLRLGVHTAEIDITPLADGDCLLAHDTELADFSTGSGPVGKCTVAAARELRLARPGRSAERKATDDRLGLLSEVVARLRADTGPTHIQLDLKADGVVRPGALATLATIMSSVQDRVFVTSTNDARLRELHTLAPWLRLGFDPMTHLDTHQRTLPGGRIVPPHAGEHGCFDDGAARASANYFADRFAEIATLVPAAGTWFVRGELILRALDASFDLPAYLHARGLLLDAWTIDPTEDAAVAAARRLVAIGCDYLTTNEAERLATYIGAGVPR